MIFNMGPTFCGRPAPSRPRLCIVCLACMVRAIPLASALWGVLAGTAIILAHPAHPLAAQVVRGRLVSADGADPVNGAMVALVTRDGSRVAQSLSRSSGLFELAAPAPAEYRVRADRIGFATTYSEFFRLSAADTLVIQMEAAVEAISLKGIETEGTRRCEVRPREGLAVNTAWEEARKALAAAAWTQERGLYRYEMMDVVRQLDPDGRRVLSEERQYRQGYRKAPYVSRAADSLAATGFARISSESSVYWAPDANVLLSDSFLNTHCFTLKQDEDEAEDLLGLAFEPVPGRRITDIEGTLWLERETAELRRLDFRYRNLDLPDALLRGSPGGRVEFEALPNGTWIVSAWSIRMPQGGSAVNPLTGRIDARLEGIVVHGGEVVSVRGNEGVVLESDLGGRIVGIVFDSLQTGLPGARVFIEGTEGASAEVITDEEGRFQISRLKSGVYDVNFAYAYFEPFGYRPEPFRVEVAEDAETPAQVNFAAPTQRQVMARLCRSQERGRSLSTAGSALVFSGILAGRVTDDAGNAVPDAEVRVLARAYAVNTSGAESRSDSPVREAKLREERTGVVVTTNAAGYYLACWVPVDTTLEVAVLEPGDKIDRSGMEAVYSPSELWEQRRQSIIIPERLRHGRLDIRLGANLP